MQTQKKTVPHVYLILLGLILLSSLLTYLIPAGTYERIQDEATGQTIVVAGSYSAAKASPVPVWKIPEEIFLALLDSSASKLIFFILFIGGSFELVMQTGSIQALLSKILTGFESKRLLIIPVFITLFSILGFSMGLATSAIVFVPIGILAARRLNLSPMMGTAIVVLGTNAGFAAGIYNPFSVGIAQTIAELPLFSGAWIRWLLLLCLILVTSGYLMFYAKHFDHHDTARLMNENSSVTVSLDNKKQPVSLSFRQKLVLVVFAVGFSFIAFGLSIGEWKTEKIAVSLLLLGIGCGIVYGFSPNKLCEIFVQGCKQMMTGVFVIGLAAAMRMILADGKILDTIAQALINAGKNVPSVIALLGLFYGNAALDLVITSGSAHAAVAMPVMVPIADALGLTRQGTVLAFQLGDGLVNLCSPLSTTLTGTLAISGIPFTKWIRFFYPLVGLYLVIGTLFILLASVTGY